MRKKKKLFTFLHMYITLLEDARCTFYFSCNAFMLVFVLIGQIFGSQVTEIYSDLT